jgi:hypothetical protein
VEEKELTEALRQAALANAKAAENQANGGSSEKARNYAEAAKHLTDAADKAVNRLL